MTQDYRHPIAPPEELVEQWLDQSKHVAGRNGGCKLISVTNHRLISICAKAAQWGADQANADIEGQRQEAADQELEACLGWLVLNGYGELYHKLRASRRSKSQSLKEQALDELDRIPTHDSEGKSVGVDVSLLRRALESIPDLFVAAFTSNHP